MTVYILTVIFKICLASIFSHEECNMISAIRDHPFSMHAKFFEKFIPYPYVLNRRSLTQTWNCERVAQWIKTGGFLV